MGPAQEHIDTTLAEDVTDYAKVRESILQTLHLSPKESSFRLDYYLCLMSQKIWVAFLQRHRPAVQIVTQVAEHSIVQYYV